MTEPNSTVRRVPDTDLGAVFGSRTEGLTGLAPRRRPAPAVTSDPPKQPSQAHEPAPATESAAAPTSPRTPKARETKDDPSGGAVAAAVPKQQAASRPGARAPRPAATSPASPVPRLVILQLPNSTADRLRDNARQRGVTYKELALDAVEATADQLRDLLADQRPKARAEGLFAGERIATQVRPEGRRQVSIKLTETSIAALDELATQHGARSRSELVATALDAYLSD